MASWMCLREAPRSLAPAPVGIVHLVASTTCERLAADLLGDRAGVEVGRVDEVPAGVEEAVDQPQRRRFVAAPAGHAEGHGAEAELRDAQARAAEGAEAHTAVYRTRAAANRRAPPRRTR